MSSSAPPKSTSAPSITSRVGRAALAQRLRLNRRHAARPCERMSIAPSDRVGEEQRHVHSGPMA